QNLTIEWVVADNQHPHAAAGRARAIDVFRRVGAECEPRRELESRPDTRFAHHPNRAAHQLAKTLGNGESEAGAAIPSCRRAVGLREGFKYLTPLFRGDADPCICDLK